MRPAYCEGSLPIFGAEMQALQADRRHSLLRDRRMEHRSVTRSLMKGGAPITLTP